MEKSRQVTFESLYDTLNFLSPLGVDKPEAVSELISVLLSTHSAEVRFITSRLAESHFLAQDDQSLAVLLNSPNDLICFLAMLVLQIKPRDVLYEIMKPFGFKRLLAAIEASDKASQPFALAFFAGFPPSYVRAEFLKCDAVPMVASLLHTEATPTGLIHTLHFLLAFLDTNEDAEHATLHLERARGKLLQTGVVDRVVHFVATHLSHRTICDYSYVLLLRLLKLDSIARELSPFTVREIFSMFVQWERMKKDGVEIHIKLQHLMLFFIYVIASDSISLIEQLMAGVEVVAILSSFLANTCSDKMALNLTHDTIARLMRIDNFASEFRKLSLGDDQLKSSSEIEPTTGELKATIYLNHLTAYCDVCIITDDPSLPVLYSNDGSERKQSALDRFCQEIYKIRNDGTDEQLVRLVERLPQSLEQSENDNIRRKDSKKKGIRRAELNHEAGDDSTTTSTTPRSHHNATAPLSLTSSPSQTSPVPSPSELVSPRTSSKKLRKLSQAKKKGSSDSADQPTTPTSSSRDLDAKELKPKKKVMGLSLPSLEKEREKNSSSSAATGGEEATATVPYPHVYSAGKPSRKASLNTLFSPRSLASHKSSSGEGSPAKEKDEEKEKEKEEGGKFSLFMSPRGRKTADEEKEKEKEEKKEREKSEKERNRDSASEVHVHHRDHHNHHHHASIPTGPMEDVGRPRKELKRTKSAGHPNRVKRDAEAAQAQLGRSVGGLPMDADSRRARVGMHASGGRGGLGESSSSVMGTSEVDSDSHSPQVQALKKSSVTPSPNSSPSESRGERVDFMPDREQPVDRELKGLKRTKSANIFSVRSVLVGSDQKERDKKEREERERAKEREKSAELEREKIERERIERERMERYEKVERDRIDKELQDRLDRERELEYLTMVASENIQNAKMQQQQQSPTHAKPLPPAPEPKQQSVLRNSGSGRVFPPRADEPVQHAANQQIQQNQQAADGDPDNLESVAPHSALPEHMFAMVNLNPIRGRSQEHINVLPRRSPRGVPSPTRLSPNPSPLHSPRPIANSSSAAMQAASQESSSLSSNSQGAVNADQVIDASSGNGSCGKVFDGKLLTPRDRSLSSSRSPRTLQPNSPRALSRDTSRDVSPSTGLPPIRDRSASAATPREYMRDGRQLERLDRRSPRTRGDAVVRSSSPQPLSNSPRTSSSPLRRDSSPQPFRPLSTTSVSMAGQHAERERSEMVRRRVSGDEAKDGSGEDRRHSGELPFIRVGLRTNPAGEGATLEAGHISHSKSSDSDLHLSGQHQHTEHRDATELDHEERGGNRASKEDVALLSSVVDEDKLTQMMSDINNRSYGALNLSPRHRHRTTGGRGPPRSTHLSTNIDTCIVRDDRASVHGDPHGNAPDHLNEEGHATHHFSHHYHSPEKERASALIAINHHHANHHSHNHHLAENTNISSSTNSLPPPSEANSDDSASKLNADGDSATANNTNDENQAEDEAAQKANEKRKRVAFELLHTEETYVKKLGIMINEIKNSLTALSKGKKAMITQNDINAIFSVIEIIYNINAMLLADLTTRINSWHDQQLIGDIFSYMCPQFKAYNEYINNYDASMQTIKKCRKESEKFVVWMDELQNNPLMENNGLQSFLILPVQRMPRYEMLLKELYKDTAPTHPDYATLATAIDAIVKINIYLNEKKKQAEANQRLLDLAQDLSGKLAHELVRPNMHLKHDEEIAYTTKSFKYPQSVQCIGRMLVFNGMIAFTKKESAKKTKEQVVCLLSFANSTVSFNWTQNDEMPGYHDLQVCYQDQETTQMLSVSLTEKTYSIINPLFKEQA